MKNQLLKYSITPIHLPVKREFIPEGIILELFFRKKRGAERRGKTYKEVKKW